MQIKRYAVWYRRQPRFVPDPHLTVRDVPSTHVLVGHLCAHGLEDVFQRMQGENWSPDGEARPLIEHLGLEHTSMSVGDVIHDEGDGGWYEVVVVGFRELPRE